MNSLYKKTLRKKFINYLIPSVCAMWIFSLYTIVDGIFVGRYVGPSALAAVNISMPFINLIFAISILFSVGASTVISMCLGKNDFKKANSIFTFGIASIIAISVLLFLLCYFNITNIAYFLGAKPDTIGYITQYLRTILFFNGCFMIAYYLEVLCKTDGSPYLSIIGVVVAAFTNILLDYIFVGHLNMGVFGAAFATGLSQLISGGIFLIYFLSKKSKLTFSKFKIDLKEFRRIISIGFPDSITELATGVVILLFNKCILIYIGNTGVVAYSIISYINSLVVMSMIGINQGMQPLISFYYGKGAIKSVKYILKLSLLSVGILSLVTFIGTNTFTSEIVNVFIDGNDPAIKFLSINTLRLYSISFLLIGFNILIGGFLAAIERPSFATLISISRGLIVVIVVLLISIILFGGNSIWLVTPVSETLCLVMSVFILVKVKRDSLDINADGLIL